MWQDRMLSLLILVVCKHGPLVFVEIRSRITVSDLSFFGLFYHCVQLLSLFEIPFPRLLEAPLSYESQCEVVEDHEHVDADNRNCI